jgi:hypothetical protein
VTGASPSSTGRGPDESGPPGFDFVEVQDAGAVRSADAVDQVDAGVEPSRWSSGFDRAIGRGTAALGTASARLGRTGIAVLTVAAMAAFVVVIAATSRRPTIEQPAPATRLPVAASGCPNISRCATRDDSSGSLASALAAHLHLTSLYAWSTFDVDSGRVYRTMVIASSESEQFAVASQCLPGAMLPNAQPIRIQHVSSSPHLPDFGPYAYITTTLVRQPSCSVVINAIVPETKTITDPNGNHSTTVVPDTTDVQSARTALAVLSLDPDIWVS